jgi:hypothetical protein
MSNILTARPITLTTAMSSGYQTAIGSVAGNRMPIRPTMIVWHNPTTVGDTFSIIDPVTSNVMFQGVCSVAKQQQSFTLSGKPWKDFQLNQISSGTVMIYE